jgi:hypothetical protein
VNVYGFAEGDPVSYSDPYGLCPWAKDEARRRSGEACTKEEIARVNGGMADEGIGPIEWGLGASVVRATWTAMRSLGTAGFARLTRGGMMNNRVLRHLKINRRELAVDAEFGGSGLGQVHIQFKDGEKIVLTAIEQIQDLPRALRNNEQVTTAIERGFEWLRKVAESQ